MSVLLRHLARLFATASNPVSPAAGDLWWRSDLNQAHTSDGSVGIPLVLGPTGNLPVVRATGWHSLPPAGSSETLSIPADRLYALPLWPGRTCTLTAISVNVVLALLGGTIRMGLYSSDGSVPTTRVADYGTVTAGVTGARTISGLSTEIRPSLHFLSLVRQGGVLDLELSARSTWSPLISSTVAVLDADRTAYYRDGVSGALPASFGAITASILGPAASIQLT